MKEEDGYADEEENQEQGSYQSTEVNVPSQWVANSVPTQPPPMGQATTATLQVKIPLKRGFREKIRGIFIPGQNRFDTRVITLKRDEKLSIGSAKHNNLVLDQSDALPVHTLIRVSYCDVVLHNMDRAAKTYLNNRLIRKPARLGAGDKIRIGGAEITIDVPPELMRDLKPLQRGIQRHLKEKPTDLAGILGRWIFNRYFVATFTVFFLGLIIFASPQKRVYKKFKEYNTKKIEFNITESTSLALWHPAEQQLEVGLYRSLITDDDRMVIAQKNDLYAIPSKPPTVTVRMKLDPNSTHCSSNAVQDCKLDVWAPNVNGSTFCNTSSTERDQSTNVSFHHCGIGEDYLLQGSLFGKHSFIKAGKFGATDSTDINFQSQFEGIIIDTSLSEDLRQAFAMQLPTLPSRSQGAIKIDHLIINTVDTLALYSKSKRRISVGFFEEPILGEWREDFRRAKSFTAVAQDLKPRLLLELDLKGSEPSFSQASLSGYQLFFIPQPTDIRQPRTEFLLVDRKDPKHIAEEIVFLSGKATEGGTISAAVRGGQVKGVGGRHTAWRLKFDSKILVIP